MGYVTVIKWDRNEKKNTQLIQTFQVDSLS